MNNQSKKFVVSSLAMRPASDKPECFYCRRPIGAEHKSDCVLIQKKVKVRMVAEYEIDVPSFWEKSNVEFCRNDGSWCANNAIEELQELSKQQGCLCPVVRFEYLADVSDAFLSEK